jgi:hypothetical protein
VPALKKAAVAVFGLFIEDQGLQTAGFLVIALQTANSCH